MNLSVSTAAIQTAKIADWRNYTSTAAQTEQTSRMVNYWSKVGKID